MSKREPPRTLKISKRTMAAWGRVHAHLTEKIMEGGELRRMYGGRVPDSEVFDLLVTIADRQLGTRPRPEMTREEQLRGHLLVMEQALADMQHAYSRFRGYALAPHFAGEHHTDEEFTATPETEDD